MSLTKKEITEYLESRDESTAEEFFAKAILERMGLEGATAKEYKEYISRFQKKS